MIPISIIAAVAKNGVIGVDNDLPWRLPDDLAYFKKITIDKPIIMGRKTWESLNGALPNRTNIVISSTPSYQAEGAVVLPNMQSALEIANSKQATQAMVIGGAMLFAEALPLAQNCYLTEVNTEIAGDVYFPEFDRNEWIEVSRRHHPADERHAYDFDFVHLLRNTA